MDVLDKLKAAKLGYGHDLRLFGEASDEIARLRAEAEANRVDAERYRWLRHADMDGICVVDVEVWLDMDIAECEQVYGEKLDAAIDAARGNDNG